MIDITNIRAIGMDRTQEKGRTTENRQIEN